MDWEKALDHVSDGVLHLDGDWHVRYANTRSELLVRRRREELLGASWWDLFPYLEGTPTGEQMREIAAGRLARRVRVFHPPLYAWHEVLVAPSDDGVLLVVRDVTDVARLQQTEAVREGLREVFDQAPIAITLLRGPEHRVEITNPMARQLLGGRSLEGRTLRNALPELEGQGLFDLLDEVFASGKPYVGKEVPITYDRNGDGTLYEGVFNVTYQPLLDHVGKVTGVLSLSVEVTDLVRAREGGAAPHPESA